MRQSRRLIACVVLAVLVAASADDNQEVWGKPASHWVEMLKDQDAKNRAHALQALAKFFPPSSSVVNSVAGALKDTDADVRAASASALMEYGPSAREAVAALSAALTDELASVRLRAALALGNIGARANSTAQALSTALADPDAGVRLAASFALDGVEANPAKFVPQLITLAGDPDADLRAWTFEKLAVARDGRGRAVGLQHLKDENVHVRRRAASALGCMGADEDSVSGLISALSDAPVQEAAVEAIGHFGRKAALALVAILGKDDARAREGSVRALRIIGPDAQAATALIRALSDDEEKVREAAVEAVSGYGAEVVPSLLDSLLDLKNEHWESVSRVIGRLEGKARSALAPLTKTLLQGEGAERRKRAAVTLARMGMHGRAPLVAAHLEDDPDVVKATGETNAGVQPMNAFAARKARKGGTPATERAVNAGLLWLARHQGPDGGWKAATFTDQCAGAKCDGDGSADHDTGVTGLALLALLGAGFTPGCAGEIDDPNGLGNAIKPGDVLLNGLGWLVKAQGADGCLTQKSAQMMYDHAIGTLALAEAYGMTSDYEVGDPAQKAVDFLVSAKNPFKAWRYTPRCGENDTSVTAWAVDALRAAELSDLNVGHSTLVEARDLVDFVTDKTCGKCGYQSLEDAGVKVAAVGKNEDYAPHEGLSAAGMVVRQVVEHDRKDPILDLSAKLLAPDPPVWDEAKKKNDYCYWYYGTLALFLFDGPGSGGGGKYWKPWNEALANALVNHQEGKTAGCAAGSWPATDRWGFEGGRVYATALNTMTLEVYYRCAGSLSFQPKKPKKSPARDAPPDPEAPAKGLFDQAKNLEKNGVNGPAAEKYQEVVQRYPGTDAARKAEVRLLVLEGK